MNKATKGAIAAGAAGILLLGGAGTFALWADTDAIDPASISTGVLTLGVGTGEWYDATAGTTGTISDINTFNIVPGDTVTYTTPVTVTAQGDNLKGKLTIDKAALASSAADYLTVSVSNTAPAHGLSVDANGVIGFTTANTYTFDVTVTVVFKSTTGASVGQNTDIDLAALALTLDQV
jgi:alternate signal-mediated exported protein